MAIYYFDSSALVKRYVAETGSAWVDSVLDARDGPGWSHVVALATVGIVEVAAALSRLVREGQLGGNQRDRLLRQVLHDSESRFLPVELTGRVRNEAVQLTRDHALRGFDAVHLGSARILRSALEEEGETLSFVSSDHRLNEAAAEVGFKVIDPGSLA